MRVSSLLRVGVVASALGLLASAASAEEVTIKFATLAPDGSSWMKLLKAAAKDLATKTAAIDGGKVTVKIKYFAGGSAGDEKDAIRKIRGGQLDGAAVTAVGLGMIQPEVRVQELPGVLTAGNNTQLDCVRNKLAPDFEKKFYEKGYILLGWGDVGPVHIFTNVEFKSMADLKKGKFWAWTDDDIIREFIKKMNLNGEPLGVPGVLPALQTGKIDSIYASPLATVALQWYTKVKYMSKAPIGVAIGAMIIRKESFEKLPPDVQTAMRENAKAVAVKLKDTVRKDNDKAIKAMVKGGIKMIDIPADISAAIKTAGDQVSGALVPKLFSKDLLDKVKATAAGCK